MQTNGITSPDNKFGGKANFCDQLYIFVWRSFFISLTCMLTHGGNRFCPSSYGDRYFLQGPSLFCAISSNPDVCVEVFGWTMSVYLPRHNGALFSSWYRLFFKIFHSLNKTRSQALLMSFDTLIVFLLSHSFHAIGSAS